MFFRRKDFHGGRAYDSDLSDNKKSRLESRASSAIRWITQWSPLQSVAKRSVRRKSEGFSLLGSDDRHGRVRELGTEVFPMGRQWPTEYRKRT